MGLQTFQVGSVGQDILLNIYFFYLVIKMTPLKKHKNIFKKSDVFLRKFQENILILQKFSAKFL